MFLSPPPAPTAARRSYRESGLVHGSKAGNQQACSIDGTRGTSTIAGGSSSPLGAPSGCVDFVEEHMPLTDNESRQRVRDLNDQFRKTLDPTLGRVMLTAGVDALPSYARAMAIREVATFDVF